MITLKEQLAKLAKYTPFTEMHGSTPVPGMTLDIAFNVESAVLTAFHPDLRGLLYCKLGAKTHNLADKTAQLPDLRFERIDWPLKWRQHLDESVLTIHIGDREDHAMVLPGKVKKPWRFTPMQGGSVVAVMGYNCHPDVQQSGQIQHLQKNEIRISFNPGKEVEDQGDDDDDKGDGE